MVVPQRTLDSRAVGRLRQHARDLAALHADGASSFGRRGMDQPLGARRPANRSRVSGSFALAARAVSLFTASVQTALLEYDHAAGFSLAAGIPCQHPVDSR